MPATDFGEIKPGRYAQVTPETSGADYHLAEVKLVDRVIDAASGTFNVRLEIPNPDHKIPGGLRCKLQFLSESESARIRDQRSSLQHESAGEFDAGESPSDSSQAAYESPVIMSGLGQ
jgi:hypothetical protein